MWDLIVSVPDHCLSFYFTVYHCGKTYICVFQVSALNKLGMVGITFYFVKIFCNFQYIPPPICQQI